MDQNQELTKQDSISPSAIPAGLMTLERDILALFLAVFEDISAIRLLTDHLVNLKNKLSVKVFKKNTDNLEGKTKKIAERIVASASIIEQGDASDNLLRLTLWEHIKNSFGLRSRSAVSPQELDNIADAMAAAISAAATKRSNSDSLRKLSKKSARYWARLAKDLILFATKKERIPFDNAVCATVVSLLNTVHGGDEVSEFEKQALISKLRDHPATLVQEVFKRTELETLWYKALLNIVLAGGGILVALIIAVDVAGFEAYILAAKSSSIIPLVGSKTMVMTLYVLSHPMFVLPTFFITVALAAIAFTKSVRRSFAVSVGSLLAFGGEDKVAEYFSAIRQ